MKFLVIGSNSFSGAHFVKELIANDNQVLGVSRSKEPSKVFLPYYWNNTKKYIDLNDDQFKFFQIDINRSLKHLLEVIEEFKPEYIVNFASQGMVAESWLNPMHWYKTNLLSQVEFHHD